MARKKNPYQVSVSFTKITWGKHGPVKGDGDGICYGCGIDGLECERYAFPNVYEQHNYTSITVYKCCDVCAEMDYSLDDARKAGRRFTEIYGCSGSYEDGSRCVCGAVIISGHNTCIRCSIAKRMLSRAQTHQRLISAALKQLKHELKEQINKQNHLTIGE